MYSKRDNILIAVCGLTAGAIFALFFLSAYSGKLDFLLSTEQTDKPSPPRGSDRRQDT